MVYNESLAVIGRYSVDERILYVSLNRMAFIGKQKHNNFIESDDGSLRKTESIQSFSSNTALKQLCKCRIRRRLPYEYYERDHWGLLGFKAIDRNYFPTLKRLTIGRLCWHQDLQELFYPDSLKVYPAVWRRITVTDKESKIWKRLFWRMVCSSFSTVLVRITRNKHPDVPWRKLKF